MSEEQATTVTDQERQQIEQQAVRQFVLAVVARWHEIGDEHGDWTIAQTTHRAFGDLAAPYLRLAGESAPPAPSVRQCP